MLLLLLLLLLDLCLALPPAAGLLFAAFHAAALSSRILLHLYSI
jgi:hypothetical protein